MTVHLISIGESIREFFDDPYGVVEDPGYSERISNVDCWEMIVNQTRGPEAVDAWLRRCLVDGDAETRDSLAQVCDRLAPSRWPARVSAELDTFARVPSGRIPISQSDIAVLISSDTADGLKGALWNAVGLTHGDFDRVRYLPDPEDPLEADQGSVVIARIGGMDARDEGGFQKAMRGLGVLGGQLARAQNTDVPFRFYLSGGFKAAIPYLIGLAEGLRSLPCQRPVDAYVLHELTEGTAIKMPLRRMVPEVVQDELAKFRSGPVQNRPKVGRLEGYAYEYDGAGRCWRLTPYGIGLLALFQTATEGLGG